MQVAVARRLATLRAEPLAWSLAAVLVALTAGMSARRWFFPDELEAMQAAWKIHRGQEIYVDFLQLHHPLLYYLLQPLFWVFGPDLAVLDAARFLFFLQLLTIYAVVHLIGRELYGRTTAVVGVLFLAAFTLFTQAGIEIRPDVPMTLCGLLGVYLLLRYLRLRRPRLLVASGLALCLAFLFLQKAAVLILLVGAVVLLRAVQRDVSLRELAVFGGTMLAGLAPFVLYLLLDGSLATFRFYNYTFAAALFDALGPDHRGLRLNAVRLAVNNAPILLLFALSLALVPKDRRQWEAAFLGLGWLASTTLAGRHLAQYYLLGLPFVALTAAQAVEPLLGRRPRLLAAALLLAFIMPALSYARHVVNGRADQMARFAYVHAVTGPDDYVYDGNMSFNLFRRDLDFVYFIATPANMAVETLEALRPGYRYEPYALIERYEPRVISDVRIDVTDPRIAAHYEPVPGLDGMYVRRGAAVAPAPEYVSDAGPGGGDRGGEPASR